MVTRELPAAETPLLLRRHCLPLLLTALLLSLSACTFSFTYRQLDWLIPWHLSDYVSFDSEQRSELEQRLVEKLQWHCRTQLDAYAEWFREMHAEPHPLTRDDLERHYQRSLSFWTELMENLAPDVTALLFSASDSQVNELMNNLERHNRELEKHYVTASWKRVRQRRIDRMAEIMQRWVGPLTESQKNALERWSADLGQSGKAWMANRRRWQRALKESFALRGDHEQFAARIHTLFVEPQELWSESYIKVYARLQDRTLEMLAEVAADETWEQERYFRKQLLSWEDDFEQLSCSQEMNGSGHVDGQSQKPGDLAGKKQRESQDE